MVGIGSRGGSRGCAMVSGSGGNQGIQDPAVYIPRHWGTTSGSPPCANIARLC